MSGVHESREQLEQRLRALEGQLAERDRLLLDLDVHREEVRQQNLRLQEMTSILEESRDRYADLYDFAPTPYLTLDAFGAVSELNLAAAALLGSPRGSLLTLPLVHRIAPESRATFLDHMRRCRQGEHEGTSELELLRPDGSRVPVELLTRRVRRQESPPEFLSALHDLSERRRAESERASLLLDRERERAASEAKGRFLATLSHELRTPLTPILATVSALERQEDLEAGLQRSITMIRRNVELEARLIDDLLDLTRIEHGKLRLEREPLDVHRLLERLLDDTRRLPQAAALALDAKLAATAHHVDGDRTRLQQVFWNLLTNALKFTPAGGRVSLRTTATSDGPGHGACFTVTLATVAPLPRRQATGERRRPRGAPIPSSLLLVEDHADTADALAALLGLEGLDVTVARSVREALAVFDPARHQLLVSDLALPDGTGHALVAALRERAPQLRAIALSGFGADDDVKASLDAGFREHLTKPVDFDVLVGAVKRIAKG